MTKFCEEKTFWKNFHWKSDGYSVRKKIEIQRAPLEIRCSVIGKVFLDTIHGNASIGSLHDPVTWYGINYVWTQVTQGDFQNKGTRTSPARLFFVLKVGSQHNLFRTM